MKTTKDIFNAFEMKSDYHYYEDPIYAMNAYFDGFNVRQLKTFFECLKYVSMSYTDMYRYSTQFELTDDEKVCLASLKRCTNAVDDIFESFSEFKQNNWEGRKLMHYIEKFDRWIKPSNVLEGSNQTIVKVNKNYSETEYTLNEYKSHYIQGLPQSINGILFWGHWIDYTINGLMESDNIDFDVSLLVYLKNELILTIRQINDLPNIKL